MLIQILLYLLVSGSTAALTGVDRKQAPGVGEVDVERPRQQLSLYG